MDICYIGMMGTFLYANIYVYVCKFHDVALNIIIIVLNYIYIYIMIYNFFYISRRILGERSMTEWERLLCDVFRPFGLHQIKFVFM